MLHEPHLNEILTNSVLPEPITAGFNPHRFRRGPEAQAPRNAVDENRRVVVFKLDHFSAINADEVAVIRRIEEIRVVDTLVASEIDFPQELTLHEKGDGTVERCPRSFRIESLRLREELFSGEMVVAGEGCFNNDIALPGSAHALLTDIFVEALFDFRVH